MLEFFVAVGNPVDFEGEVDVSLELGGNPRVIDVATRDKEVQRRTLSHANKRAVVGGLLRRKKPKKGNGFLEENNLVGFMLVLEENLLGGPLHSFGEEIQSLQWVSVWVERTAGLPDLLGVWHEFGVGDGTFIDPPGACGLLLTGEELEGSGDMSIDPPPSLAKMLSTSLTTTGLTTARSASECEM